MTTTSGPRVRVLRGLEPRLADIGTVSARPARDLVVDPRLVRDATEEGYRGGYEAGFAAGLDDAAAAIDSRELARADQLRAVLAHLTDAADTLPAAHAAVIAEIEARVVEVAFAIAVELVGHDLAHDDARGRAALVRALHLAPDTGFVRAHLHADDVATAGDLASLAGGRAVTIVADSSLQPGDCIVDIEDTRIDARIAPAIERVRAVLLGATP